MGRAARWAFARASVVTAPSEDLLDRARQVGARGRLVHIPYGADPDAFRADPAARGDVRTRLGIRPDEVLVAAIGRFVHWKGFGFLVDAVAEAQAEAPGLRLVFVGDGDLRTELEARVTAAGLDDQVTFVGFASRAEMPRYLAASDVVAVPSIHYEGYVDGLPNVALEAMAAGRPLVASRVGGLPQLVRNGVDGIIVEEKDSLALAGALVKLARDVELRERMGRSGREQVVESRNWDEVARAFTRVYEDALQRPAARG